MSSRLAPNADKSFKQAQFYAPCLISAMEMGVILRKMLSSVAFVR